ncbi:MAG: hypothetical protein KGJ06_05710 [Pseudomonadota bacterium]|nr:hypothetical protein [Pseudomonadota bacterium]
MPAKLPFEEAHNIGLCTYAGRASRRIAYRNAMTAKLCEIQGVRKLMIVRWMIDAAARARSDEVARAGASAAQWSAANAQKAADANKIYSIAGNRI